MNLIGMPKAAWRRQPVGAVRINRKNELATRLKHLVVPFGLYPDSSNHIVDYFGNPAPFYGNTNIERFVPVVIDQERFLTPAGSFSGHQSTSINFTSTITNADDITCFSRIFTDSTSVDRGFVSFNAAAWSWLDTSEGVLRVSAHLTYDTTNVISTPGIHDVGLIWKANNQYQTIVAGKFSQAGTAGRRPFTGSCGPNRGGLGWSGSNGSSSFPALAYGPAFWGVWARALAEGEVWALHENPWQIFDAETFKSYFIPSTDVALPTLSAPTAINITSGGFQPRVTATY